MKLRKLDKLELKQARKEYRACSKHHMEYLSTFKQTMKEAKECMKACGDTNPPKEHVAVIAMAIELQKGLLMPPIPNVKPMNGPIQGVFYPDGLK